MTSVGNVLRVCADLVARRRARVSRRNDRPRMPRAFRTVRSIVTLAKRSLPRSETHTGYPVWMDFDVPVVAALGARGPIP